MVAQSLSCFLLLPIIVLLTCFWPIPKKSIWPSKRWSPLLGKLYPSYAESTGAWTTHQQEEERRQPKLRRCNITWPQCSKGEDEQVGQDFDARRLIAEARRWCSTGRPQRFMNSLRGFWLALQPLWKKTWAGVCLLIPQSGESTSLVTYIWSFNPRSISSSQSPLPGWLNRFGSDVDKR